MHSPLKNNEDNIIAEYTCKEAQTYFRRRQYTAWYTLAIPINDGPYKFKGLPGLIVKIKDTKNQHCFTLNSFKSINYIKPLIYSDRDYIEIDYPKYIKTKKVRQEEIIKMVYNMKLEEGKNPLEIEVKNRKKNLLKNISYFINNKIAIFNICHTKQIYINNKKQSKFSKHLNDNNPLLPI